MKYEDALREWGARKIESVAKVKIDRASVKVEMDFDEGYACCGGRDPDCYCSFAQSPSASVEIRGYALSDVVTGRKRKTQYGYSIDHDCFDFATILGEIVEASGGAVE